MATPTEIEDAFVAWVESVTTRRCYVENKKQVTGNTPYVTILLTPVDPLPHDAKTYDDARQIETVRGLCLATVVVTIWGGEDAQTVANRLRNSIQSDLRHFDLWAVIGKGAIGNLLDLTEERNGTRRQRHEFRVSGYTTLSDQFDLGGDGYFDQVTTTVNDSNGQTQQFTVGTNIPPQ